MEYLQEFELLNLISYIDLLNKNLNCLCNINVTSNKLFKREKIYISLFKTRKYYSNRK